MTIFDIIIKYNRIIKIDISTKRKYMNIINKMCLDKKLYITYDEALKALKRRQKMTKLNLRIYKCPHCKGYHLTSKSNI